MSKRLAPLTVTAALILFARAAAADDAPVRAEDASIGTTPARVTTGAPSAPPAQIDLQSDESTDVRRERGPVAPIATDPPSDWAVLHAGLRPHLGTFGGIGTFALAHARTERFYGALSLSAIRNDAGTHLGVAQVALGRNLADTFGGGMQLSLTENRARNFVGLGQTALAYNRAGEMTAIYQLAVFNRARAFDGGLQLGLYNRTDQAFRGIAQVGMYDRSSGDFTGIVQLGAVSSAGGTLFDASRGHRFAGVAQVGLISNASGNFYGLTQVGVASFTGGDFVGLAQIGALAGAQDFRGLVQVGGAAISETSIGIQLGAAAISFKEHTGLQLGGAVNYGGSVRGAQIGIANIADEVRGVQIGIFNHAKSLRGVQIGLANHAEDGVLPWTAILNMGFGDGDDGGEEYARARHVVDVASR